MSLRPLISNHKTNKPCMLKIEWLVLQGARRRQSTMSRQKGSASIICLMKVVTHLWRFLGCGDNEDSNHERRPNFVDLKPIKGMDTDICYINF